MRKNKLSATATANDDARVKKGPGRPKLLPSKPAASAGETEAAAPQAGNKPLDEAARIEGLVSDEQVVFSEFVGQLMGQRQLARAIQKLVTVTDLLQLQRLKETKEYYLRKVQVVDDDGRSRFVTITTWAEFCLHVAGRSVEQVDADLLNLKGLGGELMEALQMMGLGYREMRRIRIAATTEEQRDKLLEFAKSGNREELLDQAEQFAEERSLEATKLAEKLKDKEQQLTAKQATIAKLHREKDDLEEKINLPFKAEPGDLAQTARAAFLLSKLNDAFFRMHSVRHEIAAIANSVFQEFVDGDPLVAQAVHCIEWDVREAHSLAAMHQINVDLAAETGTTAPWMRAVFGDVSTEAIDAWKRGDEKAFEATQIIAPKKPKDNPSKRGK